jgi:S-adenosylmethionine:tRNA ribosyltransferase-isomerase
MRLSDFDYELPDELIAQHPAEQRSHSRMLHVDGANGEIADRQFLELALRYFVPVICWCLTTRV